MEQKVVVLHGFEDLERDKILALIKAVREIEPEKTGKTIFAMTTPTNLTWKLKQVVRHVVEEDKEMKEKARAAKPADSANSN